MNLIEKIRLRRAGKRLIKEIGHALDLREDTAPAADIAALKELAAAARAAVAAGNRKEFEKTAAKTETVFKRLFPPKPFGGLRENFEILVVAMVVAVAFRTYFVQPYKIPTSSMSPTLQGIHYLPARPGFFDRFPIKVARWLLLGEWYVEVKARASGHVLAPPVENGVFAEDGVIRISGVPHMVFRNMAAYCRTGDFVLEGRPLAGGLRVNGDHIFVNRLVWNYRGPKRGEIMVFKTHGINHPAIKPNEHYVKRLVGLPGERVRIEPPRLLINGEHIRMPPGIARIEECAPGYYGYRLAEAPGAALSPERPEISLGPGEFLACGDNQLNSADSRYWGPVPEQNLIGPAFFLYWPFSRRWGPVR